MWQMSILKQALPCSDLLVQTPKNNKLLAQLPPPDYERLVPCLELRSLSAGQELFDMGENIQHVYFPTNCIVSLTIALADGYTADTAMIGKDGMVGIGVLGNPRSFNRAYVRCSGFAYRLSVNELNLEFMRTESLMRILLSAAREQIMQMAQSSVCARYHSIEQQVVKWLLTTLDKIDGDSITITQGEIARMLGVRRESVSMVMGKLIAFCAIACTRGKLKVVDKARLLSMSCECYETIRRNQTVFSKLAIDSMPA
ncbi:Crp/Fnr family transcriptional regulator [Limnohabitans sp. T6-5]|uniref:Crp/Fnr family transcriptional regulator n=1 Tax=Limnohabitans sp. T6-5 TaxID=1100724 RepID=UPI001E2F4332|nr:Crp/Fnr family transcriptional regulator [Limnohabitans sp. T6-5]